MTTYATSAMTAAHPTEECVDCGGTGWLETAGTSRDRRCRNCCPPELDPLLQWRASSLAALRVRVDAELLAWEQGELKRLLLHLRTAARDRNRLEGVLREIKKHATKEWILQHQADALSWIRRRADAVLAGRAGEGSLDEGGGDTNADHRVGLGIYHPVPPSSSPAAAQGPIALRRVLHRAQSALIDIRTGHQAGRRNAEGDGVWLQLFDVYFEEYLDPLITDCTIALNAAAPTPAAAEVQIVPSPDGTILAAWRDTDGRIGEIELDAEKLRAALAALPEVAGKPEPAGGEVEKRLRAMESNIATGFWELADRKDWGLPLVDDLRWCIATLREQAREVEERNRVVDRYKLRQITLVRERDEARAEAEALRTQLDETRRQWNACFTRAGEAEKSLVVQAETIAGLRAELAALRGRGEDGK